MKERIENFNAAVKMREKLLKGKDVMRVRLRSSILSYEQGEPFLLDVSNEDFALQPDKVYLVPDNEFWRKEFVKGHAARYEKVEDTKPALKKEAKEKSPEEGTDSKKSDEAGNKKPAKT